VADGAQKGRADFGSIGSMSDGKWVWRALGISIDGKQWRRYRWWVVGETVVSQEQELLEDVYLQGKLYEDICT